MKLSAIEKKVVANMHNLPLDKQQVILELSASLMQKKKAKKTEKNNLTFAEFLTQFRQEIEAEQLDIDTSIFDRDRHSYTDREIEL
jgi:flagellar hook-basal body complex protein FliE